MTPAERPSLLPAGIAAGFCSVLAAIYGASAMEPAPLITPLLTLLPLTAVCFWLQADARRLRTGYVLDLGFLLWVFWPLIIPWHTVTTRGRHGWWLAGGLVGLVMAPTMSAVLAAGLRLAFEAFTSGPAR